MHLGFINNHSLVVWNQWTGLLDLHEYSTGILEQSLTPKLDCSYAVTPTGIITFKILTILQNNKQVGSVTASHLSLARYRTTVK